MSVEFKIFRVGEVDQIKTTQDITDTSHLPDHPTSWSDFSKWKPDTPYYSCDYLLRCVREWSDETNICYFAAEYCKHKKEFYNISGREWKEMEKFYDKIYWRVIR